LAINNDLLVNSDEIKELIVQRTNANRIRTVSPQSRHENAPPGRLAQGAQRQHDHRGSGAVTAADTIA